MLRHALAPLLLAAPFAARAQIAVTPAYTQIVPGQTVQFSANGSAVWQVNNVTGGTAAAGTITQSGLYTAPATLPSPAAVVVTAVAPGQVLARANATLTLLAALPAGRTWYVAPGGSDGNPGTLAQPFATLQHGADVAAPGDTVLARQGTYNQLLTPHTSGNTAAGPITIASYPGELATLDGTGLPIPQGQNGLVTLNNVSHVIVQGLQLQNYKTASRAQVPVGIYVTGAAAGVQLVNNHVHDIVTTAHTNPQQCGSNALGIAIYGTGGTEATAITALAITGNELDHLVTGCSESLSIDGNVDGYLVAGNHVHDNDNIGIDSIGFERVSKNPALDQARNGEVRGNLVANITSYGNPDYGRQYAADGIYVDGGTAIVIEQNIVSATDLGIELASEHKGHDTSNVIARNNLVYGNNANGISIGGYAANRGGTDHCIIVNNTLFGNDTKGTGSGEFQIQFNATHNIFQNNIADAGPQALLVNNYTANPAPPASLDTNLYFAGTATPAFRWNRVRYPNFTAYRAASMQDAHTLLVDPQFLDPGAANFDLQPSSPAFGAGADLGADVLGVADVAGNPRGSGGSVTIGAFER